MVKYKSLLDKYCCSSVDGKENTFTENTSEPKAMSPEQKSEVLRTEEDQYVPSWRAPCDAWVTANVVDCTGVNTPVYLLYNAYINDNPDDYMDIGQFGKVLRSRFPYRKRRRGKQGQQVYVYQDVALKNKEESAEKGAKSYQLTSEDPKHQNPLQQIPAAGAGPAILVGNSTGGRLLSSPRPVTEEVSALTSRSIKRNSTESTLPQSPSYKRLKVSKDITIPGPNNTIPGPNNTIPGPNNSSLRYQSSFSPHCSTSQAVATDLSLMGHPKQTFSNGDQYEDTSFKNSPKETLDDCIKNTNSGKFGNFHRTKNKNFDYYFPNSENNYNFYKLVIDIGKKINSSDNVMHIAGKQQSGLNSTKKSTQDHGFKNKQNLSSDILLFKKKNHPIKNKRNVISDLTLFKQKNDETEFIAVPSSGTVQQNTITNQHSKHEPLNITDGDEKYANTNLCRMAIGRRWIDVNLIDMVGVHTYASDVCQAYAQDHPDEPLNFTSMSLLIRGKYPGRRRKVTVGSETRYLYQDIKLIRNQVGSSQGDATSSQKSKNLEEELSIFSTEAAYESTTHKTTDKEMPSHSNPFVALQVNRGPTAAATNMLESGYVAYIPVLNYPSGCTVTQNSALVTRPIPSASYVVTKDSDLSAPTITRGNIPNLDDLLAGNCKSKLSHNDQGFSVRAKSNDKRNKEDELSLAKQRKQKIREDGQNVTRSSQGNQTVKETLSDMNVSDYLESELLEINDISKNMQNCKLSIQIPSGKQIRTPNSIPSFSQKSFRRPENLHNNVIKSKINLGKNDLESVKDYSTGFKGLLDPRSSNKNVTDTSNTGESKQCSSRVSEKLPVVDKDLTRVVKEVTDRSSLDLQQSWDYKIRKVVGPEPTSLVQNETLCMNKNKIKRNKINNNRKGKVGLPKTMINEKTQMNHLKKSESLNDYTQEVTEKLSGASRDNDPLVENKECSSTEISKGNGGSPTSTSPPCPAMNRLAEEIITSTPHVAGPLQQASAFSSSSTNVQEPRINVNSANKADPRLLVILRSIILTAQQTVSKPEETFNQALILRRLERVVIEKNPAVFYEESTESDYTAGNTDSFPCSVMPDLKDLMLSSPERVNDLLRHHQTCVGLGCSKECQILRAAYVHISIFHHKCQIWNAFSKIVSKHSRPCRVVSCGVEFCHVVKHELHLNGVSVLPMQLLKERPTLEEEFKNCEKIGTHDGELHCRHMQCPRLPLMNQSVLQFKNDSKPEAMNITMNTSSIFPDTPSGNALAVPVIKTIRLVRDLFRKSMEVG